MMVAKALREAFPHCTFTDDKHITACEAFLPMFRLARKVIASNGFSSLVQLVYKRSDEMNMLSDIASRADILVMVLIYLVRIILCKTHRNKYKSHIIKMILIVISGDMYMNQYDSTFSTLVLNYISSSHTKTSATLIFRIVLGYGVYFVQVEPRKIWFYYSP